MEFKRKKKRGINKKVRRLWFAAGGYRIVWRREAFGIRLPVRFQACVKMLVPGNFENGYTEMWDFVDPRKHLFKTMKAAVDACEKHQALWEKAVECTGIRAFYELFNNRQPSGLPKGVRGKLNGRLVRILMDTTPRKTIDDDDDALTPETTPEPTPEPPRPEKPKKQSKNDSEKPKRKPRSDRGQPRGPRKPKESINE